MDITRRDFLKGVAISVGAIVALAYSTAPDEEPVENWLAGDDPKEWVQIGLPFKCTDQPSQRLLGEIERVLKNRILTDARAEGFETFKKWEFVVHPASDSDPLYQRWSGGVKCLAKKPRGWHESRMLTRLDGDVWKDMKTHFIYSSIS